MIFCLVGCTLKTDSVASSASRTPSSDHGNSSHEISSPGFSQSSTYFRVAPKTSSSISAAVYSVSASSGSYYSTSVKTLTKGTYYTSYTDVAAYFQAFGEVPVNYALATKSTIKTIKDTTYKTYGEAARLWFQYNRTDGYMTQVPQYNTSGGRLVYYEFDISSNWLNYSSNRGALRLMAMPYGVKEYGHDPVIFYTSDHYASFFEYFNYFGGWGPNFAGRSDYVEPSTVTVDYP